MRKKETKKEELIRRNQEQTLIAIEMVNAFIKECVKNITSDEDVDEELEQIIVRCVITMDTLKKLKNFLKDLDIA